MQCQCCAVKLCYYSSEQYSKASKERSAVLVSCSEVVLLHI